MIPATFWKKMTSYSPGTSFPDPDGKPFLDRLSDSSAYFSEAMGP
jgi:hypothetical protein